MLAIPRLSAAIRRGLIEASLAVPWYIAGYIGYPRRFAAASLKLLGVVRLLKEGLGYPRRFAAASLKHRRRGDGKLDAQLLSAAIRRGLIEAMRSSPS